MTKNSAEIMDMENQVVNIGDYQVVNIGDYFAVLNRRKMAFIIPFILIMTGAILLAYILPPVYMSESTVRIERQEIPPDLVETTVTGYVQERIQGLSKTLLTHTKLWEIAQKHDLYAGRRTKENRHDIVTEMKDNIDVEMVDVKTTDANSGRTGTATIAFTVSYKSDSPEVAQKIANELASLYIAGNQRQRTKQASEVTNFLERESEKLRKEIAELESELAEFKQNNRSSLPELMDLNRQLYEKTSNEIERTREQIRSLNDQRTALQAELAITPPNAAIVGSGGERILTGSQRLSALTAEYLRLSSKYSSRHPDLVKLRREIESLGGENDSTGAVELVNRLAVLKDKLVEARRKYSDDHPDVKSLEASVNAVERGLNASTLSNVRQPSTVTAPDNPRYVSLKTQLDSAGNNLTSEKAKLAQLQDKLAEYEQRLFQTPTVDRDYKILSRGYDNKQKRYKEILAKLHEAESSEAIEASSKGERFEVVQPAFLPSTPESPNRLGIGLLGFLLAFSAGIGFVTVFEYLDRTIYNSKDLAAVFKAPPLVAIPYIPGSDKDTREPVQAVASITIAVVTVLLLLNVSDHVRLFV